MESSERWSHRKGPPVGSTQQAFWHSPFLIIIYLFVFGCAGSLLLRGLFSSCGKEGLLSSCGDWFSHCSGFSCCRAQSVGCAGSVVAAPRPSSTGSVAVAHGLAAAWHVGSSWSRDQTHVSCIGRQIPNHWTTGKSSFCLSFLRLVFRRRRGE